MPDDLDRLLVHALADNYPDHITARRLLEDAKVPQLGMVAWAPRPIDMWHSAHKHAKTQGTLLDLLDRAVDEHPENAIFHAARHEALEMRAATTPTAIAWRREVPTEQLEKIMGSRSTLLPISFLSTGLLRAKAVARVVCGNGDLATGFLISNDRFVTNHHVLSSPDEARGAVAEFGYDHFESSLQDFNPPVRVKFKPEDGFATTTLHDCTVVRVENGATDEWGAVPLNSHRVNDVDWVNIIQHPDGGPKHLALYHNVVAYADDDRVQYYTDTLPGSSGSPVFDTFWKLVAVHRIGGHIYEPGGNRWVYRNEGLNVNRLVELLEDVR